MSEILLPAGLTRALAAQPTPALPAPPPAASGHTGRALAHAHHSWLARLGAAGDSRRATLESLARAATAAAAADEHTAACLR
ncbi:hypothetical protein [Corynebacterium otitidis]|uniref:hypothetical protein n=1 Tax=Corynebacterium otitidis TaxID=29321 RepID=UPI0002F7557C|nr:hypothetical protein [Corynebacterium otitidis]